MIRFKQLLELTKDVADLEYQQIGEDHWRRLGYITEEVGEIAQDLDKNNLEHARLECVDVIVAAMGMYVQLGGDELELKERWNRGLNKWRKNLERKANEN